MTSAQQPHTLVITNDYPPRAGGIQTFVFEMVKRFDPNTVTVVTSNFAGAAEFDAQHPWQVLRAKGSVLLPTRRTRNLVSRALQATGATQVVFGAAAPLGLLARWLRSQGVDTVVAMTHGHEVGWAATPVMRRAMRNIIRHADWVTYLGQYTATRIQRSVRASQHHKFRQLTPAVDPAEFTPENKQFGDVLRNSFGLAQRPVVVCVSRLMPRKGQDVLIKAMPLIQQTIPDVALVIVGTGPYLKTLQRLVTQHALDKDVYFTGRVAQDQLAHWYAAGDVFAMPCRTRNAGWDVEGLGIVYLEASATGLPVIAGRSGGAPDAVREHETGLVVDGRDVAEVAHAVVCLLSDVQMRNRMGQAGRAWVEQSWTWDYAFARLADLLAGVDPDEASTNKL